MLQKIKDDKNRWRNKSVGFRVSPEEWDVINDKVRLCGYGKKHTAPWNSQDFGPKYFCVMLQAPIKKVQLK